MTLPGKTFFYRYESGLEVTGHFKSATALDWEALTGPARGTKGTEAIHTLEVTPNVFFVSWLESSGTTVSQVLDLGRGRVAAFVTYDAGEGRRSSFDTGTVVER
jgi:phenolic acid decarboxylase